MPGVLLVATAAALLQPTSKWVVNFDDSQCAAARDYGTAAEPLTLLFKQPIEGDVIQLAIAMPHGGMAVPEQLDARLAWNAAAPRKVSGLVFTPKTSRRQLYLVNLPKAEVEALGSAAELTLEGSGLHHRFRLGGIDRMLSVMGDCVKDLRKHFNAVEEGAPDPLKRHAATSLPRLFSSDDYPAVSARNDEGGYVRVVVLINPDGKVADCTLTKTSGLAALDAQTCVIIKTRARYTPALGADGKPARDVDNASIRWVMPD